MKPDDILEIIDNISPDRMTPGREAEFFKMIDSALDVGVAILDENMIYRYIGHGVMEQLCMPAGTLCVGDSLEDCHNAMIKYGILAEKIIKNDRISTKTNTSGEIEKDANFIHELSDGRRIQLVRKKLSNGYLISMAFDVTALVDKDLMLEEALRLGNAGYWTYCFETKTYNFSNTVKEFAKRQGLVDYEKHGILHLVHEDDRSIYKSALSNLSKTNDYFEIVCRAKTSSEQEVYLRSKGKVNRDANGRPSSIRTFFEDVTKERIQSIALEKAKDEAIAASHAKSEFLANMSHEIRTPMNGILGMAELLANSNINDTQRDFVNVINDSSTALLKIINDILDFSKIEAGALELDPIPFDLRDSIADVVALIGPMAKEKGLEIIVNYPTTLQSRFIADSGRLRQVITNIVNNAVKFTNSGHIIIEVDTKASTRASNKRMVCVNVTDTGIGIEQHKTSDIFKKFTQADGSTTRNYGGTGLGLSISRKIVELMNGRMSVTSTYGEGSTFGFTVPLKEDSSKPTPIPYDTTIIAGKRVLIIDDIEINRTILSQQTLAWGMRPHCCKNGIDAIVELQSTSAQKDPYDLILTDFLMPVMNGHEVATMISSNSDYGHPPIIMLSSCDQSITSEELLKIGIQKYLTKPVRDMRLLKTITSVLSAHVQSNTPIEVPKLETTKDLIDTMVPPPAQAKIELLVAEDFKLNQDVVRLMLADTNFEPIFANNGLEAVRLYTKNPARFPLILMDISMPIMDGYEATNEINSFNEANNRPHTPIIALTGHALKNDKDNCLDAGMDDYLSKPVQQGKLLAILEKHFAMASRQEKVA